MIASLVWGAPQWLVPAVLLALLAGGTLAWSYSRAWGPAPLRVVAALLKAVGVGLLALCLLDPLLSSQRPRKGANLFVIVADNSQSLQVVDVDQRLSRADQMRALLSGASAWQQRLSDDFDVRRYTFDTRLSPVADFAKLSVDGSSSMLMGAMQTLGKRFGGRPLAGILLLSDGNATDQSGNDVDSAVDWANLPPIYPVALGTDQIGRDIRVDRVHVNQTNFESNPITVTANIVAHGMEGAPVLVELLDGAEQVVDTQMVKDFREGESLSLRFQLQPQRPGISFYRVRASAPSRGSEATLENNSRLAIIDRSGGPYRILYVAGRPNWEFKFLGRAIEHDHEVHLVGLTRLAKREPKFTFRSGRGESSNPFFQGFGNQDREEVEQYDEPVFLRFGVADEAELRDGFPKTAEDLFRYNAIILDDVEADLFDQEQMALIDEFVQRRGGGLLMLGGQESFARGDYRRTSLGEILPVYLDPLKRLADAGSYKFTLTREGWLEPWARIEPTQARQQQRMDVMPRFRTLNRVRAIKPAATVVARAESEDGTEYPALVVQEFGKGRTAALLIGDLWRWHLRRGSSDENEAERFWRQLARWLVGNGQKRLAVETKREGLAASQSVRVTTTVRDAEFRLLDNAEVKIIIHKPHGKPFEVTAEPSATQSGVYETTIASRLPGSYRAEVVATAADGSAIASSETGWVSETSADEFGQLTPSYALLERLAQQTGGEMIEAKRLDAFVRDLPNRRALITEPLIVPLWHKWTFFFTAVACLIGEWGLRRWKGLP